MTSISKAVTSRSIPFNVTLTALFIWGIAGLFYLFEFIHRVAPSVMTAELMQDFAVSAAALGSLSAFYFYAYASMQIPVGILLDRFGTRPLLVFAAFCIFIGSFLFGTTETLAVANLSRFLIGLGSAFSFVGCLKLGAAWFPAKRFALIVGFTNLLGVCGAILGGRPLALLLNHTSWRTLMQGSAILSLIFMLLLFVFIQDKPVVRKTEKNTAYSKHLKQILKTPHLWGMACYGSLMVAPIAIYAELWGVSYLMAQQSIDKAAAAQIVSLIFIGIAIGGPTFGWLGGDPSRRLSILFIGSLGALLTTSAILFLPDPSFFTLSLLHLSFGFFTSCMLLCFSINTESVPRPAHGIAIGLTNTVVMALSALFQPLVGKFLDLLIRMPATSNLQQFTAEDYQLALSSMLICQAAAILLIFLIRLPKSN